MMVKDFLKEAEERLLAATEKGEKEVLKEIAAIAEEVLDGKSVNDRWGLLAAIVEALEEFGWSVEIEAWDDGVSVNSYWDFYEDDGDLSDYEFKNLLKSLRSLIAEILENWNKVEVARKEGLIYRVKDAYAYFPSHDLELSLILTSS